MKLSTRTRYGIRAVLELAENYGKGPLQLKIIAEKEDISVKYLEQLMTLLKTGRVVDSIRGAKGGYILAKPPNEITLGDCFCALEGSVVTVSCVEDEDYCHKTDSCVTRQIWIEIQNSVMGAMQSKTLQDVIDKAHSKCD